MDLPAAAIVCIAGLAGGYAELRMLSRMTLLITGGEPMRAMGLLPVKLAVLALVLIPTAFLVPHLLWLAGCALAVPLVVGGLFSAVKEFKKGKEAEQ